MMRPDRHPLPLNPFERAVQVPSPSVWSRRGLAGTLECTCSPHDVFSANLQHRSPTVYRNNAQTGGRLAFLPEVLELGAWRGHPICNRLQSRYQGSLEKYLLGSAPFCSDN